MAVIPTYSSLYRHAKCGAAPTPRCSGSQRLLTSTHGSSITARATKKSGRPMPLPEEDEDCRNEWRAGSHGLQLNPPRHRPTSSIGTGAASTMMDSSSMILVSSLQDWRTYRAKLVALERSGAFTPKATSNSHGSSRCSSTSNQNSCSNGRDSRPRHPMRPHTRQQPGSNNNSSHHHVASASPQNQQHQQRGGFCPSCWAHELAGVEVGAVLVARQDNMEFFSRSVVLIAAHDDLHGTFGFVLNKPCPLRMCEVQLNTTAAGLADVFGRQRLQLAGPCHMETLTLLHSYGGLAGAHKVTEDIHYGGLPQALDLVRHGMAAPEDFRLLLGLAGWSPGQLAAEVAGGAWHVAAVSKDIILPPPGQQRSPDYMWKRILQLTGQPHTQRSPPAATN